MEKELKPLCEMFGTPVGADITKLDWIKTDENGYVTDEVMGAVPDIRKLPRKGGCGIGVDGSSFEQVLNELDALVLKRKEAKIAEEKKALEERLAKEEAEISRLRGLSEKEILVEIAFSLYKEKVDNEVKSSTKQYDYEQENSKEDLKNLLKGFEKVIKRRE